MAGATLWKLCKQGILPLWVYAFNPIMSYVKRDNIKSNNFISYITKVQLYTKYTLEYYWFLFQVSQKVEIIIHKLKLMSYLQKRKQLWIIIVTLSMRIRFSNLILMGAICNNTLKYSGSAWQTFIWEITRKSNTCVVFSSFMARAAGLSRSAVIVIKRQVRKSRASEIKIIFCALSLCSCKML